MAAARPATSPTPGEPAAHLRLVTDALRPSPPYDAEQVIARIRQRIRMRRLSPRTEETYLRWARRYLDFHGGRHPAALGRIELERFVTHLAEAEGLAAPSVNQAASSIAFMYRELFGQDLGGRKGVRGKEPDLLPKYATPEEVEQVLARLDGLPLAAALLMYGSGTRVAETLSIRIQDLSLDTRELHVRGGKGAKDRTTVIAAAAVPLLRARVEAVERQHARDLENGAGWAPLPGALHRKDPAAGWDLGWQYLFPSTQTSVDAKTGRHGRRPQDASNVQRAVKRAARAAKVPRAVTCHVLRHCFATEMLRHGCDLKLLQKLLGHSELRTTSRYLHIIDRPGVGVVSPLDRLPGKQAWGPRP